MLAIKCMSTNIFFNITGSMLSKMSRSFFNRRKEAVYFSGFFFYQYQLESLSCQVLRSFIFQVKKTFFYIAQNISKYLNWNSDLVVITKGKISNTACVTELPGFCTAFPVYLPSAGLWKTILHTSLFLHIEQILRMVIYS